MVKLGLGATLGLSGLAVIAVLAFVFRDKISNFFSNISGGVEGAQEIGETVGLLNRNFQSNLTATPLPEDPLFGTEGFFTKIGKSISEFKFPSFDFFPSASALPTEPQIETDLDFTSTGMAGARARQDPIIREDFSSMFDITNPQGLMGDIAQAIIPETQSQFQERAAGLAETFPEIFRSTSLSNEISFGRQLSRNQEDFESVLAAEANRAEDIFAKLFGNVQNPNF